MTKYAKDKIEEEIREAVEYVNTLTSLFVKKLIPFDDEMMNALNSNTQKIQRLYKEIRF